MSKTFPRDRNLREEERLQGLRSSLGTRKQHALLSQVRTLIEHELDNPGFQTHRPDEIRLVRDAVGLLDCDEANEIFETTPAGAVLLSVRYGLKRGRLRCCKGCGRFMAPEMKGWAPSRCEDCKQLGARKLFTRRQSLAWRDVSESVRKRFIRDETRNANRDGKDMDRAKRQAQKRYGEWEIVARAALHANMSVSEWRSRFYEARQRGRPRRLANNLAKKPG